MDVVEVIEVWTDARGIPERLVWQGHRYRVTDTPTLLEVDFDYAAMTHPPAVPPGWRFQATDEDGTARVFDVRRDVRDRWALIRSWS